MNQVGHFFVRTNFSQTQTPPCYSVPPPDSQGDRSNWTLVGPSQGIRIAFYALLQTEKSTQSNASILPLNFGWYE